MKSGRVIDSEGSPTAYGDVARINAGTFVPRTATRDSMTPVCLRVQRDF